MSSVEKIAVFLLFVLLSGIISLTDSQQTTPAPRTTPAQVRTTPPKVLPTTPTLGQPPNGPLTPPNQVGGVTTPALIVTPSAPPIVENSTSTTTPRTTPVRSTPATSNGQARTTPVRLTQSPVGNNDPSTLPTTPAGNNNNAISLPQTPSLVNVLPTTPANNLPTTPPIANLLPTTGINAPQTPVQGISVPNNADVGSVAPTPAPVSTTLLPATPAPSSVSLPQTPAVNGQSSSDTQASLPVTPAPPLPQTPSVPALDSTPPTTTPKTTPINTTPLSTLSFPSTPFIPSTTPLAPPTVPPTTVSTSTATPVLPTTTSSTTTSTTVATTTFNIMTPGSTSTTTTTPPSTPQPQPPTPQPQSPSPQPPSPQPPSPQPPSPQPPSPTVPPTPTVSPQNILSSTTLPTSAPMTPTISTNPIVPITTSSMSPSMAPSPLSQDVNVVPVNIVLTFCSLYTSPPMSNDQYILQLRNQIAQFIGNGFDQFRITQLTVSSNPDTGQMVVEFVVKPGLSINPNPPNAYIINKLRDKSLMIVDLNGNALATNCDQSSVIPWTESWSCPDQKCENGGTCRVNNAGRYTCHCKSGYVGSYCNINLWPLLCLPIIFLLAALATLFLCLYCRRRKRRLASIKGFKSVTNNTTTTTTTNTTTEKKKEEVEPAKPKPRPKPLQTFYLPYNKPLSVGFSDVRFNDVNAEKITAIPPQYLGGGGAGIYGGRGGASIYGGGGGAALYRGPGMLTQTMDDPDIYYQTMGQKMALAFNDYTFVPTGRASTAGSVIFHGQNQGASNSNVYNTVGNNMTTTFSSRNNDDDVANDGSGYYHALGQKLAITFDN